LEFILSKSTDIWMPLYIGDYLSATQHLSTEQNGAYLLLLMSAWKFGGELPDDDEQLSSIAKLPLERWIKTRQVLCRFFEIKAGVWTQGRLTAEIDKAIARKAVSSTNGKQGGRPPKEPSRFPAGNPEHNPQESSSPSSLPSPATKPSKSNTGVRFAPPTLEQVAMYCTERNNSVNPHTFMAKYEANGWMVGKNKMKDWKASVRYWETTDFNSKPQTSSTVPFLKKLG
jgi:uncharacterized protein YdaU (DUF1376 family)